MKLEPFYHAPATGARISLSALLVSVTLASAASDTLVIGHLSHLTNLATDPSREAVRGWHCRLQTDFQDHINDHLPRSRSVSTMLLSLPALLQSDVGRRLTTVPPEAHHPLVFSAFQVR
ncbi:hypothetical protein N658DRAFT_492243 [Parathielavia hyrcaniae]|uniref:Uncharacterized protein n=1 Tax=Parathielavia hyrcaniae TaxID=113614 RepID=A0AAN6Q8T0_9PEZI|nr:hypothetical protein N658DRAFT_492243 [Parathielavia hyrcaniae]